MRFDGLESGANERDGFAGRTRLWAEEHDPAQSRKATAEGELAEVRIGRNEPGLFLRERQHVDVRGLRRDLGDVEDVMAYHARAQKLRANPPLKIAGIDEPTAPG
jgi:hypothetical protein